MKRFLKYASLLAAAVMFISCEEDTPATLSDIVLRVDKDVIKSDGSDVATFTVYSEDGTVITEGVTLYDAATDSEVPFDNMKFSTTTEGEYTFWASYKTYISDRITVKAVNVDIPSAAADPSPANTSFVRRTFLAQFTGTTCGYCPGMINWINKLRADEKIRNSTVLAAVHSFASGDPAHMSSPQPGAFYGNGFPYLNIDIVKGLGIGYDTDEGDEYYVKLLKNAIIDRIAEAPATAGISANPEMVENVTISGTTSDYLIVKAGVKSSETAEYAIGAWLLEDAIYGKQSLYGQYVTADPDYDYDTHNNCARVVDSNNGTGWTGHSLGTILEGKTAEKTFLLRVKNSWKTENMHLVLFVTKKGADGKFTVNNVIDCPINKPTQFEYAK